MVSYDFDFAVEEVATHEELGEVTILACIKEASVIKYQIKYVVDGGFNFAMVLQQTLS